MSGTPLRRVGRLASDHGSPAVACPWPSAPALRRRPDYTPDGETQPIPEALLETLRAWLPWLLRARTTLIGLSYNEQIGIGEAQSWFESHPDGV